jgi:hypothetical protein
MNRTLVGAAHVTTKLEAVVSNATEVGWVLCKGTPVSPETPLSVIKLVLPVGGKIVTAVAVVAAAGGVIVLDPVVNAFNSLTPGLLVLAEFNRESAIVYCWSPENVIEILRCAVIPIIIL